MLLPVPSCLPPTTQQLRFCNKPIFAILEPRQAQDTLKIYQDLSKESEI